jgi:hypothetical protein
MAKVEYGGLILVTNCHISPQSPNANDAKLEPMKAQYSFYLRSYLGCLKLHGFINGMLIIPYLLDGTVKNPH